MTWGVPPQRAKDARWGPRFAPGQDSAGLQPAWDGLGSLRTMARESHLFILRGFKQRVFLRPSHHLVEGGTGGDHGVDAVFFFYLEVDEEGFA